MKKEKTPDELAAYNAKRAAARRKWAIDHPERTRAYGRAFYYRNREKRIENSKSYYRSHREERSAYSSAYYRRKKEENPNYVRERTERLRKQRMKKRAVTPMPRPCKTPAELAEARHAYFLSHRTELYRQKLNDYTYRTIAELSARFPDKVDMYLQLYPFEEYGQPMIRSILYRHFQIKKEDGAYDDCFEAGMLAYLYSIHRCAAQGYDYTPLYIRKMIRIYIGCALFLYHEVRRICDEHHLKDIRIDADRGGRRY